MGRFNAQQLLQANGAMAASPNGAPAGIVMPQKAVAQPIAVRPEEQRVTTGMASAQPEPLMQAAVMPPMQQADMRETHMGPGSMSMPGAPAKVMPPMASMPGTMEAPVSDVLKPAVQPQAGGMFARAAAGAFGRSMGIGKWPPVRTMAPASGQKMAGGFGAMRGGGRPLLIRGRGIRGIGPSPQQQGMEDAGVSGVM